jgi:hypothetical protein
MLNLWGKAGSVCFPTDTGRQIHLLWSTNNRGYRKPWSWSSTVISGFLQSTSRPGRPGRYIQFNTTAFIPPGARKASQLQVQYHNQHHTLQIKNTIHNTTHSPIQYIKYNTITYSLVEFSLVGTKYCCICGTFGPGLPIGKLEANGLKCVTQLFARSLFFGKGTSALHHTSSSFDMTT